ncbi:acylphosphatase [Rhodocytophaga aerolata]
MAVRVLGKVQEVFFRASTQRQAASLGLTGFVQNEKDGSVYLEAEGDEMALRQLLAWLHQGPDRARVTQVEVHETDELKGFATFEQKR